MRTQIVVFPDPPTQAPERHDNGRIDARDEYDGHAVPRARASDNYKGRQP